MVTPMEVPILETRRLRLRALRPADARVIYAYATDPAVTRYMTWPQHRSIEDTEAYLKYATAAAASGHEVPWAIARRDDDLLVGTGALRPQGHRAEIGYVFAQPYWGRGYATEAAVQIVEWARQRPGIQRVGAYCHVDNLASARVLEKAGMAREGRLAAWAIFPNLGGAAADCWSYGLGAARPGA